MFFKRALAFADFLKSDWGDRTLNDDYYDTTTLFYELNLVFLQNIIHVP